MSVTLRSSDGHKFEVSVEAATRSKTIRTMIDDLGIDNIDEIPIPNVTADILERVIAWTEYHKEEPDPPEGGDGDPLPDGTQRLVFSEWDRHFFDANRENLIALAGAAHYMDIKGLLQMTGKTMADTMIKGKSPEEIRQAFNLPNDLAPRPRNRRPDRHGRPQRKVK